MTSILEGGIIHILRLGRRKPSSYLPCQVFLALSMWVVGVKLLPIMIQECVLWSEGITLSLQLTLSMGHSWPSLKKKQNFESSVLCGSGQINFSETLFPYFYKRINNTHLTSMWGLSDNIPKTPSRAWLLVITEKMLTSISFSHFLSPPATDFPNEKRKNWVMLPFLISPIAHSSPNPKPFVFSFILRERKDLDGKKILEEETNGNPICVWMANIISF